MRNDACKTCFRWVIKRYFGNGTKLILLIELETLAILRFRPRPDAVFIIIIVIPIIVDVRVDFFDVCSISRIDRRDVLASRFDPDFSNSVFNHVFRDEAVVLRSSILVPVIISDDKADFFRLIDWKFISCHFAVSILTVKSVGFIRKIIRTVRP